MKKSVVALGVIVALGVVGVGGAWFTGEKAQTEYLRQIELANKQAQALGSSDLFKVVYQNKQFERGFFTSQVEDEVVISLPKEGKVFTIPFSTKLYHGPFPLNQLEKFNFVPTMFSAQGVIGKNETTQPLFDLLKSDKPVQYQVTTSYNLSTKGKVELAGGVEGYIRAADLTNEVAAGDVVEAKYTGVDRKARIVHLSVKAKDQAEEAAAVANVNTKQEDVAIPNAMAEAFKAAKGE